MLPRKPLLFNGPVFGEGYRAFSIFAIWIEAFEALLLRSEKGTGRRIKRRESNVYFHIDFSLSLHENLATISSIASLISNSGLPIIKLLLPILSSRIDKEKPSVLPLDLGIYQFTREQLDIVEAWKDNRISLVKVV